MGAAQTRDYVDKRYEDRDVNELPDVPVEALRGLGKRGAEALHKAIGIKTIRDLATNDFVLKAQEVLRLAEGPAAIPTAAPAAAAAGTDAADHRRAQAGQQALTRSEEELEVDTKQVPRGHAGVRKRVVTEQQHRTVPVELLLADGGFGLDPVAVVEVAADDVQDASDWDGQRSQEAQ
jgi:hypothetical protein